MALPADRLPPIPTEQWSSAQRDAAAELIEGPRGGLRGPFVPLLRSPELLTRTQRLGEYIRYQSVIPQRLRELAILATARFWQQGYEWATHAPIAARCGIPQAWIDAIGADQEPVDADSEALTVLQFCGALHRTHRVDDALYQRALAQLGEAGVVELSALCGYYALLAMLLNVARTPTPAGAATPFGPP